MLSFPPRMLGGGKSFPLKTLKILALRCYTSCVLAIISGYLIGSIPFSFILPWTLKGIDIRKVGTGNVGGSNAIRNAGRVTGIVAGLLDFAKGFVAAALVLKLTSPGMIRDIALLSPIVGHCYSIFIGFKGGRGIATTLGVLLFISPLIFGVFIAISILGLLLREAGLSNFLAILSMPIIAPFFAPQFSRALLFISLFLIFRRTVFVIYDVKKGGNFGHCFLNRLLFDAPEKTNFRR